MAHSLAPEQLGAPPLNSLQFASVSLVVGRPELDSDLCKEEKSFINQMRAYTLFSSHSLIKMLNRIGSTVYLKETPHVSGFEPEESLSITLWDWLKDPTCSTYIQTTMCHAAHNEDTLKHHMKSLFKSRQAIPTSVPSPTATSSQKANR